MTSSASQHRVCTLPASEGPVNVADAEIDVVIRPSFSCARRHQGRLIHGGGPETRRQNFIVPEFQHGNTLYDGPSLLPVYRGLHVLK